MAGEGAKKGGSRFLKFLSDKFRVGADYKNYLNPARTGLPEEMLATQAKIPSGTDETKFNISFYKRKQMEMTPYVRPDGLEEDLEKPLGRGDFPGHIPRPAWTGNQKQLDWMIDHHKKTGMVSMGYFNHAEEDSEEHYKTALEIYGEGVVGDEVYDYFDTTPNYLRGKTQATEEWYKNNKKRTADDGVNTHQA